MSGKSIQPDGWVKPRGYSNGMRARGEIVAVAGQIAWDANARLVPGDFAAQFAQALSNVVEIVKTAGGLPTDLVSLTIYVTDRAEYLAAAAAVGAAYRQHMGRHFPAMALVQVAGLLEVGAKVEIQALAVIDHQHLED
jgi:enamine deaminase RidA (YjgF/YER057c/UK114 family)